MTTIEILILLSAVGVVGFLHMILHELKNINYKVTNIYAHLDFLEKKNVPDFD